jgi:hypothetical protein
MSTMKNYISAYEWEVLREPITIPKVDDTKELPEGQKKIVINRDEHYKLRTVLSTKGDPEFFREETKNSVSGRFVKFFEITGSDRNNWRHYTLESCYIGGSRCRRGGGEEPLSEADLHIHGLRIKHKTETEGLWLTEWYINGPRDNFVFRNQTIRKMPRTFSRKRLLQAPEDKNENENIHSMEVSLKSKSINPFDYLRIKACGNQFLIAQVPKEIGPDWSSNIGIEYRKEWGEIPDVEEREKIRELCSFVFGRQLLFVGYTLYDLDCKIVEEYACDSWTNDSQSLCLKPDNAPTRINKPASWENAENLISQLLPRYSELRDSLHLKDALWLYWIARDMPAETNLPLLAAAVEAMVAGWFESKKSKSRGVYMEKDKFEELLGDEMSSIESKLLKRWFSWNKVPGNDNDRLIRLFSNCFDVGWAQNAKICKSDDDKTIHITNGENSAEITINKKEGKAALKISDRGLHNLKFKRENGKRNIYLEIVPYAYNIMNKLQDVHKIGVMDQFRFFFNEIDLYIDENEWGAINARHAIAHGRIASKQEEWDQAIQHTSTYETLIHKIMLRLLGYSGSYRDRSVLGWEDKQLV